MSEREPNFESGKNLEVDPELLKELDRKNAERRELAAQEVEKNPEYSIEAIKDRIEKSDAKSKEDIKIENEASNSDAIPYHNGGLKEHGYSQIQRRTQKKLKGPQKAFSKLIHQPAVEAVSDTAGATVARPSGLLLGGLFSLIGSLATLYICRHYGYEYNFLIGMASFAGGFALGILLEGIFKLFKR